MFSTKIFYTLVLLWSKAETISIPTAGVSFTCQHMGIFPDEMNCKKYYVCIKYLSIYEVLHLTCPSGMNFDENTKLCLYRYACRYPETKETFIDESATAMSSPPEEVDNLCREDGKYPNIFDENCKSFHQCNRLINGTYLDMVYTCEDGSYFNPITRECDVEYICPTSIIPSSESTSTQNEVITMETQESTTEIETTTSDITIVTAMTTTDSCDYSGDSGYLFCSSKGRFRNTNDSTCQTYYLCNLLRSGSFIQTLYSCPNDSYFNPSTQTCDVNYECPCKDTSITSTSETTSTHNEVITTETQESTNYFESTTSDMTTVTEMPTTDSCDYNEDSGIFSCSSKGRFRNPNDSTCQTYYLCNLLRSGSFLQTLYSCPNDSYFNPSTQTCDVNYECPCKDTSITSTSEMTSTHNEVITTETQESRNHFETPTSDMTTVTEMTTTESCDYNEDSGNYSCSSKGRFRNPNDSTCQTYYLCNLLRSGSFLQTLYSCPNDSYFNPSTQTCDVNYECPCKDTSITSTSETTSTHNGVITTETQESTNYFETTTSDMTTVTEMPTTDSCDYNEDSEIFSCSSKGRFRNPNDSTCQTYYLCNLLRSGSFIQTLYSCPNDSYFNPSTQTCDVNYECPCKDTSITSTSETTSTHNGVITTETQESTNYFETTTSDMTTVTEMPTTDSCDYNEDSEIFSCSSKGRFRNPNDSTCQTYYLCNLLRSGSFIQTLYSCPNDSYFNPSTQTCDVNYECPCKDTSITSTSETTFTHNEVITTETQESTNHFETTTSDMTTVTEMPTTDSCDYNEDSEIFSCSSKGRFRNPNDSTCQTYYLCNLLRSGSFIQTLYSCPNDSYFNPSTQTCDVNYECPCKDTSITSTSETTSTHNEVITTETQESTNYFETTTSDMTTVTEMPTTDSCDYNEDSEIFSCSSKGRFRNPNDSTCQTYYLCNLLRSGSFIQTLYSCPNDSYFNPSTQTCDVNYECPCKDTSITSTSETTSTHNEVITTETQESTNHFETPTSDMTTVTEMTTTESCDYNEDSGNYSCNSKGRFRNPNDSTCQTYYLCNSLRSGSFIQTLYSCPNDSYFNPSTQTCDVNYECPCKDTSITSTSETTSTHNGVITTETQESTNYFKTTTSDITTVTEMPTTDSCDYNEDSGNFSCSSKGRFRNPNDSTCQTYYLCNSLRSGSFIQTLYSCPNDSYFNPSTQTCDVNYECPCKDTSITSTSETTSTHNEVITTETQESTNHFETPTSDMTTVTEMPTTDSCDYDEDSGNFSCSSKGRFRNPNDSTCQTYYLCNLLRSGSFIQTLYSCPNDSYFNPSTQTCDVDYECPCKDTSITSTSETTSTHNEVITTETQESTNHFETPTSDMTTVTGMTTTESCDYYEDSGNYSCSSEGRFRNPNDSTCQTYYLCNLLRSGSFIQTLYSCPNDSYFNPLTQTCDVNYECPCEDTSITSTSETTSTHNEVITTGTQESTSYFETTTSDITTVTEMPTTDSCDYNEDSGNYSCSNKGRFRNPNDSTCQTYYLCNLLRSGSFIQTLYSCPNDSYFNPSTQTCDVNYECPCKDTSITSTSETTSTHNEVITTETQESTNYFETTTSDMTTVTEMTTTESCDYNEDSENFSCSSKGRFRNPNDPTCQTYYLCNLLRSGSFIQTLYSCPKNSFFNSSTQTCDVDHKCFCK